MYDYDVIICGGGCAGLNLLFALKEYNYRGNVLIIESNVKTQNDRTWSFWDKNESYLDTIIAKQWQQIQFKSSTFSKRYNISPYLYKTIRGIDFYQKGKKVIEENSNFYYKTAKVKVIGDDGMVTMDNGKSFRGELVFNTIIPWHSFSIKRPYYLLLQHFKGWVIETSTPVFDENCMTYMDFDIPQSQGGHFMYILPFTSQKALVEYTIFSTEILEEEQYTQQLKTHIKYNLKIKEFKLLEEEYGVIPMTDYVFPSQQSNSVFNIGTGGGSTKASTGYTFQRVQNQALKIAKLLSQGKHPKSLFYHNKWSKYYWYDKIMLNVMYNDKYPMAQFFTELFQKKGAHRVLQFLDEQTTLFQDLYFFNIPPKGIFFKALLQEIYLKLKGK